MTRKVSVRKCVSCFIKRPKFEFLRVVRLAGSREVLIDESLKLDGRGAYICKSKDCLRKAKAMKRLDRAMKCKVRDEIYEKLISYE